MHRNLRLSVMISLCLSVCVNAQLRAQAPSKTLASVPASSGQSSAPPASKPTEIEDKVEKYLRNLFAWGPEFEVKAGPAKPSPIPDLLEVPVTVGMQGQSDAATVYVSKDGKFIIRGDLSDMSADSFADVRAKLHPGNSPSMGPENAKVTLIEFADFECPSCRQLDRILRELLPKHPEVRLVYKDFPLTEIHPWAMTASIAAQCAYRQDPAAFWKMHDIIFDSQDLITPANVWDKMHDFANQLNLDKSIFETCVVDPAIQKEIADTQTEGRELNVNGTPTIFVNGRRVAGPDKDLITRYLQFISYP
jgi:protein-disulfide isomerase